MVGTILFKAVFDLESVINLYINHRINLLLCTCETCICLFIYFILNLKLETILELRRLIRLSLNYQSPKRMIKTDSAPAGTALCRGGCKPFRSPRDLLACGG